MENNRCVVCGEIIPEGLQVCPICANKHKKIPYKKGERDNDTA